MNFEATFFTKILFAALAKFNRNFVLAFLTNGFNFLNGLLIINFLTIFCFLAIDQGLLDIIYMHFATI